MIRLCKSWLDKPWDVRVSHISRDQNMAADSLAKFAVRKHCDWIEYDRPPESLRPLICDECSGSDKVAKSTVNMH